MRRAAAFAFAFAFAFAGCGGAGVQRLYGEIHVHDFPGGVHPAPPSGTCVAGGPPAAVPEFTEVDAGPLGSPAAG